MSLTDDIDEDLDEMDDEDIDDAFTEDEAKLFLHV